jgi:S1-C subfamily serine protease
MGFYRALLRRLCLCAAAVSAPAQANDAQVVGAAKNSIVFVRASVTEPSGKVTTETGTGFICSSSGYVLTANHILQTPGARVSVTIGSNTGETLTAYIAAVPNFVDAALLQLPDSHRPYKPISFGDPDQLQQGDHVIAAGFPLSLDYSSTNGSLSNKAGGEGLWQISVPLNYGNSGGPILNEIGQAVGMIRGGVAQAQQINYMIPLNLLSPLITGCGLIWPPYNNASNPAVTKLITTKPVSSRCHEVTDVAAGIPPVYTKRMECE